MPFPIPKFQHRAWHLQLGATTQLLSETGYLKRINKTQQRTLLVLAYELGIAKRLRALESSKFDFSRRIHRVDHSSRKAVVPVSSVFPFEPRKIEHLVPRVEAAEFIAQIDPVQLERMLRWVSPLCYRDAKSGYWFAYSHALLLVAARQRILNQPIPLKSATRHLVKSFTLNDFVTAYLKIFEEWFESIPVQRYVCRLANTADEAAMLTNLSRSTAAIVRAKEGVIPL